MTRLLTRVLVALVLVAGVGIYAESCHRQDVEEARKEAARMKEIADAKAAEARNVKMLYDVVVEQIGRDAQVARKVDTVLLTRIKTVRDSTPVPDLCKTVVKQRDSLIDAVVAQGETWRQLYDSQMEAGARLSGSFDSLSAAYDTLSKANKILDTPVRRSIFARLLHPEIRPAAFAGFCGGTPCAGFGIALTLGKKDP